MQSFLRRFTFFVFILGSFFSAEAFQKKMKLSSMYKALVESPSGDRLIFQDIEFEDDIFNEEGFVGDSIENSDFFSRLNLIYDDEINFQEVLASRQFEYVEFINVSGYLDLRALHADTLYLTESELEFVLLAEVSIPYYFIDGSQITDSYISFSKFGRYTDSYSKYGYLQGSNNEFDGLVDIYGLEIDEAIVYDQNSFNDGLSIDMKSVSSGAFGRILENVFQSRKSKIYLKKESDSVLFRTQVHLFTFAQIDEFTFGGNKFKNDGDKELSLINANFNKLTISQNIIDTDLILEGSVNNQLNVFDNELNGEISITDLNLGNAGQINIQLEDFLDDHLAVVRYPHDIVAKVDELNEKDRDEIIAQTSRVYYSLINQVDTFLTKEKFNILVSDYYRLHSFYRDHGFRSYADQVYLKMKSVELQRLKQEWQREGGFERFVKWQLNSLLKFYTYFGTSPARAIVISLILLLCFTVFYFFFPSEWDTKSKAQLIQDFRDLWEKNDKGIIKPLGVLFVDFLRSLVNAFSLSLNTFITLGFGTIPTTGIARYVCILQGFLGWFLLSIFTASLISQILY